MRRSNPQGSLKFSVLLHSISQHVVSNFLSGALIFGQDSVNFQRILCDDVQPLYASEETRRDLENEPSMFLGGKS